MVIVFIVFKCYHSSTHCLMQGSCFICNNL